MKQHGTGTAGCAHEALLYRGPAGFEVGVVPFVRAGVDAGEPVMVALPPDRVSLVREALGARAEAVRCADMTELGRNPGRIIPAVRAWADEHPGRPLRFVGEPIWSGRGARELVEATRHEALLNVAFAGAPVTILCPYDAAALDPATLADAERTHPHLRAEDGTVHPSAAYEDPVALAARLGAPLPEPPAGSPVHAVTADLAALRGFVEAHAAGAGLRGGRLADLLLAANEAATNVLLHGRPPAAARVWAENGRVVCEVADLGRLEDPLAGRAVPPADALGGRGLWLMNQLCDLVELRSDGGGTVVRLHVER